MNIIKKNTESAYADYREYVERLSPPEELISRGQFEDQFRGFKKFIQKIAISGVPIHQGMNYVHMTALSLQDMMIIPVFVDGGDVYIPLRANATIDGRPMFLPILGAVKVSGYKYYTSYPISFNGDYKWKNARLSEVTNNPSHSKHIEHIKDIINDGFVMKIVVVEGTTKRTEVTTSQLLFFKMDIENEVKK